jgi:hypothetical protein
MSGSTRLSEAWQSSSKADYEFPVSTGDPVQQMVHQRQIPYSTAQPAASEGSADISRAVQIMQDTIADSEAYIQKKVNVLSAEQKTQSSGLQTWMYVVFGLLVLVIVLGMVSFFLNRKYFQKQVTLLETTVRSAKIQAQPGIRETFPTANLGI